MGALAKITRAQVFIIAAVLLAIVLAALWFLLIKPQQEAYQAAKDRYDTAYPQGTPDKLAAAKADLAKAQQEVRVAEAKWAVYDRALMQPGVNISNPIAGTQQWWRESILTLGPKADKFLHSDPRVTVLQSSIQIPAPFTDPNQINKKVFDIPLGTVSVQGTFQNVLAHAERWNKFDRLIVVDGLSLSGTSPRLVGTYTLHYYLFTHGEPPTVQVPQAAQGMGGGAMMPGGMPMGQEGPGAYPERGQ